MKPTIRIKFINNRRLINGLINRQINKLMNKWIANKLIYNLFNYSFYVYVIFQYYQSACFIFISTNSFFSYHIILFISCGILSNCSILSNYNILYSNNILFFISINKFVNYTIQFLLVAVFCFLLVSIVLSAAIYGIRFSYLY